MTRYILIATMLLTGSCGDVSSEATPTGDEAVLVPLGKADDFFSTHAREYRVEGLTRLTIEDSFTGASEARRLRRVQELLPYRHLVVGFFLNGYLIYKWPDDADERAGGFGALTRNRYEEAAIQHVSGNTYQFRFQHIVAGELDLIDLLGAEPSGDGRHSFTLPVGDISTQDMQRLRVDEEWYEDTPWKGEKYDPDTIDQALFDLHEVTIRPEPRSADGWIDTKRLFADGALQIAIHIGWDEGKPVGFHETHPPELYQYLLDSGFESPVDSYDDYIPGRSGPLVAYMDAGDRVVEIDVWLRWGKPGSETDPDTDAGARRLEDILRADLGDTEVIIYTGHAGPFYGFFMGNWDLTVEGALDDTEIADIVLFEGQQIIYAEGCNTYALAEAFFNNPSKDGLVDTDLLTTTSFANGEDTSAVQTFVEHLAGVDRDGKHVATRWGTVLSALNHDPVFNSMYGVHGIDDSPHLHPYANLDAICEPCRADAACGGDGNLCVSFGGQKACTPSCTADDGCPSGYLCQPYARGNTLKGAVCAPASARCDAIEDGASTLDAVVINEIGAAPPAGDDGDYNGDGTRDARADEFVELVNRSDLVIDLSGWTLADGGGVQHVFRTGTFLAPRGAAVVFGGGEPDLGVPSTVVVVVAAGGLKLNDNGDVVVLANARGAEVDRVTYSGTTSASASPGRQADGSDF